MHGRLWREKGCHACHACHALDIVTLKNLLVINEYMNTLQG